jgi:hypothetical protein
LPVDEDPAVPKRHEHVRLQALFRRAYSTGASPNQALVIFPSGIPRSAVRRMASPTLESAQPPMMTPCCRDWACTVSLSGPASKTRSSSTNAGGLRELDGTRRPR